MEKESQVPMPKGSRVIKTIYFYLVSFVALLMIVLPGANLIDLTMRNFVFHVATYDFYPTTPVITPDGSKVPTPTNQADDKKRFDEQQTNQMKRDIARDVSFLLVGIPLFIFNWRLIRRNKVSE